MTRRRLGSLGAVSLLVLLPAWPVSSSEATDGEGPRFTPLLDRSLCGPLLWSHDVRWSGDQEVLLSAVREGVLRLSTAYADAEPEIFVAGGTWTGPKDMGLSERFLAASIDFGALGWMDRKLGRPNPEVAPLNLIGDLDVYGDRLALLGTQRGEDGRWAPEGGLAFVGSLSRNLEDLHAIAFSAGGPGSLTMARCALFDTGSLRFLEDGRLVVVPGVEPGVFLYAPDGELLRTWASEPLGFHDDCEMDDETQRGLQADPAVRNRWSHSRVLLEDVFDLGGQPALVLRYPEESGTSWEVVVLEEEGIRRIPFPVTTRSTKSFLRVARRGDRLAALIIERGHFLGDAEALPRLVVLRIEP